MGNIVIPTPFFESKYKRLAGKYPSLGNDLAMLEKDLAFNPKLGEPLGAGLFKSGYR